MASAYQQHRASDHKMASVEPGPPVDEHLTLSQREHESYVRPAPQGTGLPKSRSTSQPVRNPPSHSIWLRGSKRAVDAAAALFFFAVFGWLFFLLWVGVTLTSKGPALYSQKRYGKGGKIFKFYKFRSMVANADQVLESHLASNPSARLQWNEFQKLDADPRITKFGLFIRKSSLDELPQFWNVLIGDMSLVGPRPCMTFQKDLYGHYWDHYCAVRPGITGLWQVSGRNNLSYKKRIALDVRYVENLSVWRDIHIFLKTIWVVATGHGSR